MRLRKCAQCGEILDVADDAESAICWNCDAEMPVDPRRSRREEIDDWLERRLGSPNTVLAMFLPLALLVILGWLLRVSGPQVSWQFRP